MVCANPDAHAVGTCGGRAEGSREAGGALLHVDETEAFDRGVQQGSVRVRRTVHELAGDVVGAKHADVDIGRRLAVLGLERRDAHR